MRIASLPLLSATLVAAAVASTCTKSSAGGPSLDNDNGDPQATPGDDDDDAGVGDDDDGGDDDGDDDDDDNDDDNDDPKFDIGDPGSGGPPPGTPIKLGIIWIANSGEGTVSKIDTKTAVELARYRTGEGETDPSRTSVALTGAVAVANRTGSVTKIAYKEEHCVDKNGDDVIQTSTGATDVLAWGEDECVLWHTDLEFEPPEWETENRGGPRAIAWDAGTIHGGDPDENEEEPDDSRVWVGWRGIKGETDQDPDTAYLVRLDGITGSVDAEVKIPDWKGEWKHGAYGGATDYDRNFWALGTWGTIVRVDAETLEVTRWDIDVADFPELSKQDTVMYGMALDAHGMPWLTGYYGAHFWRFNTDTEEFEYKGRLEGGGAARGLAIDRDGYAWIAASYGNCRLIQWDINDDVPVNANIALPGCSEPVGVSIDSDGFPWIVDRGANLAYKLDPTDLSSVTVENLVKPYTYSDMTGYGLTLVIDPPE